METATELTETQRQLARRAERIYQLAVLAVKRNWNGTAPRLGKELHRALVAEELMRLIAAQDASLPADIIRRLVDKTWEILNADPAFLS